MSVAVHPNVPVLVDRSRVSDIAAPDFIAQSYVRRRKIEVDVVDELAINPMRSLRGPVDLFFQRQLSILLPVWIIALTVWNIHGVHLSLTPELFH